MTQEGVSLLASSTVIGRFDLGREYYRKKQDTTVSTSCHQSGDTILPNLKRPELTAVHAISVRSRIDETGDGTSKLT